VKGYTILSEYTGIKGEIIDAINNLDEWMKPEHVKKDLANIINTLCIQRDPLGVVCVFSAWNYAVMLLLQPLAGAIAAGWYSTCDNAHTNFPCKK